MRDTVLVIGSTCVDVLIRVEHLPRREDNLHPAGQRFMVGGCAYNVAQVLAQGRAELTYVTPVGMQGVFGPFLLPMLRALPWARPIALEDKENGCCYCLIEPDGERTFLSIHGAEYTFDPAWMEGLEQKHFDWCYVCGLDVEEPTGEALVDWLEAAPIGRLFYAPGPRIRLMPPERTQRLLALRPILHLNRAEALTLSGAETLEDAADFLYAETAQPVIITLGAEGAAVRDGEGLHLVPGCPVSHVVDTVGAGDAHAGALLLGLSRGLPLEKATALANQAAARAVMVEGASVKLEGI
ncbi:MAG: carbohydrate kinase family protein [Clostridia bacterium]|nr:carbohydrate kinase family protein [Clostridia bacterium]